MSEVKITFIYEVFIDLFWSSAPITATSLIHQTENVVVIFKIISHYMSAY